MKKGWLMLFVAATLLSGCGKQDEMEVKNEITIASYDATNTASDYVRRGNLDGRETVTLRLQASQEQEYFFEIPGLLIEKVYVTVGDEVKEGQLLAEAANEDIKKLASESSIAVTAIEEGIAYQTRMLSLEKQKKEYNEDKKQTNLDAISRHTLEIEKLNNELSVAKREAGEWAKELKKTQIYATEAGIVSYVGVFGNGITSDEKMPFVKVQQEDCGFAGVLQGEHDLAIGQKISLSIDGVEYPATIQMVNLKEGETELLAVPDEYIDTTQVTTAEYVWSREPLNQVLYVPTEAIVTVQGEHYVYVYDENGFPDPVKVRIGKMGPKYTNIEAGVKEGDLVELF